MKKKSNQISAFINDNSGNKLLINLGDKDKYYNWRKKVKVIFNNKIKKDLPGYFKIKD